MNVWCRATVAALSFTAVATHGASAQTAQAPQLPWSVEFRVPKGPSVAANDSGAFAAYEIHVTNLTTDSLILKRIEVLDGSSRKRLLMEEDSVLRRDLARPGTVIPRDRPADVSLIRGGLRAVVFLWVRVDRKHPPTSLHHRLTFQRAAFDTSMQVLEGADTPVNPDIALIGAPLRGRWAGINGPSNASGHRRFEMAINGAVVNAQRFAIDFLKLDSTGARMKAGSDPKKNESYLAYGSSIYAVADGLVIETKDSIPENVPGGRAVTITLETVGGNHIILDIGHGRYAFYAHVQPGSLRVKVGDRVRRGQVIALVGNSGNSTEPHLHFHIVDAPAAGTILGAEGLPYAIEEFDVEGSCAKMMSGTATCTLTKPMTVRNGIPIVFEVLQFRK